MITSGPAVQVVHVTEKFEFSLLNLYIEQYLSTTDLQQLVGTIQASKDSEICFYPFTIPIRLEKCYAISDTFPDFIINNHKRAIRFAQQIIYNKVKGLCSHANQIAIRFVFDKLPPRPEFHVLSNNTQSELLSRSHPVHLSGTVIASSAIVGYVRGMKYVCNSLVCPLSNQRRQKFILFDFENLHVCNVMQAMPCEGCNVDLDEDINKRWVSDKLVITIKLHEPEVPFALSTYDHQSDTVKLSSTYTIIVRDQYIQLIRLGGKLNFVCYVRYDPYHNRMIFETLHCEPIQQYHTALPNSIYQLYQRFSHYHSFSFLNRLSSLFCPHIQLAKYCIHAKMGLMMSLVSSPIHVLIVGNESRIADILCRTALKYAQDGIVHRQQHPLILEFISKSKQSLFTISAGSIAAGDNTITYLENIDNMNKSQKQELFSTLEANTLSIGMNKTVETSEITYSMPLNTNIWAYHDSRLWSRLNRFSERTNDLSPALANVFSLVLPIDEINNDYEATIEHYLDEIWNSEREHEVIDQCTIQWINDIRNFLIYVRAMEIPLSHDAEVLLKKYFCTCRRIKLTLFSSLELPASTNHVITKLCEGVAKCNMHVEASESDMILAIYMFEISIVTRLGSDYLTNDQCRLHSLLTNPTLIDSVEHRMICFSQELNTFCEKYGLP